MSAFTLPDVQWSSPVTVTADTPVLLGGLMLESNDLKERLTGYDAKAATLQQQIEDEQTRTEEIDKLKKYMETDEYAEEVAREKLGLVKDNETVFKKQQ